MVFFCLSRGMEGFSSLKGNGFCGSSYKEGGARCGGRGACGIPPQGPNDFSFLRKRKAFWISKEN